VQTGRCVKGVELPSIPPQKVSNEMKLSGHIRRGRSSHAKGAGIVTPLGLFVGAMVLGAIVLAVRLANSGSYLMAHNSVECKWTAASCIVVFSQFAEWPVERAVVEDNDVLMSTPKGAVFGDSSAGINVRGFAHGIVVRHNTIRGRARAGLAMYGFRGGVPTDCAFIDNRFDHFEAALADVFVGSGVLRKRIVGPGTVVDQSEEPMIER
jgi:hypothetical protein